MSTKKKTNKAEEAETAANGPEDVPAESAPAEYNPARLITPQEACSYHGGGAES